MVMSGVREMTLAEEIRNLAELGVDQNVIDRMTQKYNRMLTDHGNTCNKIRDEVYREVRGVKAELAAASRTMLLSRVSEPRMGISRFMDLARATIWVE